MGLKIAIVGLSESTQSDAPFHDTGWETWGLGWCPGYALEYTRVFEMHDPWDYEKVRPGYIERLEAIADGASVYMQKKFFKWVTLYPFADIKRDYFTSSVAYMVAMAATLNPTHISLYGVDINEDGPYSAQRACIEYWIGVAESKGIKVCIPEQSSLLKFSNAGHCEQYTERYGKSWL